MYLYVSIYILINQQFCIQNFHFLFTLQFLFLNFTINNNQNNFTELKFIIIYVINNSLCNYFIHSNIVMIKNTPNDKIYFRSLLYTCPRKFLSGINRTSFTHMSKILNKNSHSNSPVFHVPLRRESVRY